MKQGFTPVELFGAVGLMQANLRQWLADTEEGCAFWLAGEMSRLLSQYDSLDAIPETVRLQGVEVVIVPTVREAFWARLVRLGYKELLSRPMPVTLPGNSQVILPPTRFPHARFLITAPAKTHALYPCNISVASLETAGYVRFLRTGSPEWVQGLSHIAPPTILVESDALRYDDALKTIALTQTEIELFEDVLNIPYVPPHFRTAEVYEEYIAVLKPNRVGSASRLPTPQAALPLLEPVVT